MSSRAGSGAGPSRPRHNHDARPGLPYARPRGRGGARPPARPRETREQMPMMESVNAEADAMRLFQELEDDEDQAIQDELNEALVAQTDQRARLQASEAQLKHLKASLSVFEEARDITDEPSPGEERLERTLAALASSIEAQRTSLKAHKAVVVGLQKTALDSMLAAREEDILGRCGERIKNELGDVDAIVAAKVQAALLAQTLQPAKAPYHAPESPPGKQLDAALRKIPRLGATTEANGTGASAIPYVTESYLEACVMPVLRTLYGSVRELRDKLPKAST